MAMQNKFADSNQFIPTPSRILDEIGIVSHRSGQSLIEIIIGLGIGAVLIGAGAFAIAAMLRSNLSAEKYQAASAFSQELTDSVRSYAGIGWDNLYNLAKGSSTTYFLNASGTTFIVVDGEEGMLDNDIQSGLVGEWKFDENAASTSTTTYDATGNNYHGTLTNGPTRASSTCKIANCLSFDGNDDYANIPWSTDLSNGSLVMWFRSDSSWEDTRIFFEGDGSVSASSPSFEGTSSFMRFYVANGCQLNSSYTQGSWVHIVGSWDGSKNYLYMNGTLMSSSTCVSTESGFTKFTLGSRSGSLATHSTIDDVRVYNRALSAEEVKRLQNSGVYKRFFAVENVCRTTDVVGVVNGTPPCAGGSSEDAATEQITAHSQWTTGAGTTEARITGFITRAQNEIFRQTDWSGGSGDTGSHTAVPATYASGTNILDTSGSLEIGTLTQQ